MAHPKVDGKKDGQDEMEIDNNQHVSKGEKTNRDKLVPEKKTMHQWMERQRKVRRNPKRKAYRV